MRCSRAEAARRLGEPGLRRSDAATARLPVGYGEVTRGPARNPAEFFPVTCCDVRLVRLLLRHSADVAARDALGRSAQDICAEHRSKSAVKALAGEEELAEPQEQSVESPAKKEQGVDEVKWAGGIRIPIVAMRHLSYGLCSHVMGRNLKADCFCCGVMSISLLR